MSDEPRKDGMYIHVELPKGTDLKAGDSIAFTTRWQSDAPDYPEATSVFGHNIQGRLMDFEKMLLCYMQAVIDDDSVVADPDRMPVRGVDGDELAYLRALYCRLLDQKAIRSD